MKEIKQTKFESIRSREQMIFDDATLDLIQQHIAQVGQLFDICVCVV